MKNLSLIVALTALGSVSVYAAEPGFYLGGDIAQTRVSEDGFKARDNGWSAFAGYTFNETFSAEVLYRDMADKTVNVDVGPYDVSTRLRAHHAGVALLAGFPASDTVSLYGRLGVGRTRVKARAEYLGFSADASKHKTEAVVGLGARFAFNRQLGMRAEYTRHDKAEANVFALGLDYRF
ncbi:porin family protein [Chitinimonas lacunae]|uniref:Porin family protein n=1 Tax=Chitinimonas lacunae TaxID=1963018 RepID=A0ABV8MU89_9NEIS